MRPSTPDPWTDLRRLTAARIALGRAGSGQRTTVHLDFQLAHARARDAVHHVADMTQIAATLSERGVPVCRIASAAGDRATYLRRPDLGRRLAEGVVERLARDARAPSVDLVIVIADGLSGHAVESHAVPLALAILEPLRAEGWTSAPVVLVEQGRVALGDEIGAAFGATLSLMLIGERPGLSSPDSLGAYLTWHPAPGRTDADRNCVSNIRVEGLPVAQAAERVCWLLREARRRAVSGVTLKEEMGGMAVGPSEAARSEGTDAPRPAMDQPT